MIQYVYVKWLKFSDFHIGCLILVLENSVKCSNECYFNATSKTEGSVGRQDTHIGRTKRTSSGGDEQAFGAATNKLSSAKCENCACASLKMCRYFWEMEMDVDEQVDVEV